MGNKVTVFGHHDVEVDDGKVFTLGGQSDILDLPTGDATLYGFYTMRDIEITAVEAIVVEAMMCADTAGIVSVMSGSTVHATITAVDNTAANGHMSGVVVSGKVAAGSMVFIKTTTANDEGTSETGTVFVHIEYR